ncbi:metallophosphoesterase [Methanothermococcus sp. SCGC AD-155-N22]|nr:metallophosphoesterase [Methanothermococcus sp. SCGC AD-155-N22]
MRIVGITDLHGKYHHLKKILLYDPDVLVISGDITHFGRDLKVIDYLRYLQEKEGIRILAVPGNCDTLEVIDKINGIGINLDGKCVNVGGIYYVGIGGSNRTPFNTPNEYSEEELYFKFINTVKNIEEEIKDRFILITHAPPFNTMADRTLEGNVGSVSIRKIIEEYSPILVACGHIHESRCIDKLGNTYIVNPSPRSFFVSDIYIKDKIIVKSIELVDF